LQNEFFLLAHDDYCLYQFYACKNTILFGNERTFAFFFLLLQPL